MENVSMLDIAKSLVEKFYQLDLKISSNPASVVEKECGYKSMSTIKYAEGFNDGKENLYQHSVEFANELLANADKAPEEKLLDIVKEVRTLVRNELSSKVVATFLNTCLQISYLSPKFFFSPSEIEELSFNDKYDEDNNAKVIEWMINIVDKEYNK